MRNALDRRLGNKSTRNYRDLHALGILTFLGAFHHFTLFFLCCCHCCLWGCALCYGSLVGVLCSGVHTLNFTLIRARIVRQCCFFLLVRSTLRRHRYLSYLTLSHNRFLVPTVRAHGSTLTIKGLHTVSAVTARLHCAPSRCLVWMGMRRW